MRLKIQGGFYPNFISLKLLSFRLLIRLGDEGVSVTVYVGDGGFNPRIGTPAACWLTHPNVGSRNEQIQYRTMVSFSFSLNPIQFIPISMFKIGFLAYTLRL